jgi:hypothetical protein
MNRNRPKGCRASGDEDIHEYSCKCAHTRFEKKRKPGAGESGNVANLKKDENFDE